MNALDNLSKFNSDVTLKQATYAFIASQLMSKQERDNLSKVFKAFDKNGDGKVDLTEWEAGMKPEMRAAIEKMVDASRD